MPEDQTNAPPFGGSSTGGPAQRAWLRAQQHLFGWGVGLASLAGTAVFAALAAYHTASANTPASGAPAIVRDDRIPANAPSQSLFQGQGDSSAGGAGSSLAPAPALPSPRRSRVRTSSS
jgi:hypothetical protein